MRKQLVYLGIGLYLSACAPTQFVVPLEKGEHAVSGSLGGPIIRVPSVATIPIPFTTVGYGYGLNAKSVISGTLYPTAGIFGVFQFGGQYMYEFWKKEKYNLTGKVGFDYFNDVYEKNQRFYPQLDANFSYTYQSIINQNANKRKTIYVGLSNWFELNPTKAHGEKQTNRMIFNPHVGHQMRKNNWAFNFELAFLAPNVSNQKVVVDYVSAFGKNGATGIYLGFQYFIK